MDAAECIIKSINIQIERMHTLYINIFKKNIMWTKIYFDGRIQCEAYYCKIYCV